MTKQLACIGRVSLQTGLSAAITVCGAEGGSGEKLDRPPQALTDIMAPHTSATLNARFIFSPVAHRLRRIRICDERTIVKTFLWPISDVMVPDDLITNQNPA
jgi:hypothetical protein